MALTAPVAVDTRPLFRPVSSGLVEVLRGLSTEDWERPTLAGTWVVRDVVAHLVDGALRRVSFQRDGMKPPSPAAALASERELAAFVNGLNAQWVGAARRLSPRVLTGLYERAGRELADWFESFPLDGPALFPVSWAGEQASAGWFDVGREFTELWHHQQQVRMAVGAAPLADARHLRAVIAVAVHGLPHAYRDVAAEPGETVVIDVGGDAGGRWTLSREDRRWTLWVGEPPSPTARVRLDDQAAWRLLFNALPEAAAARAIRLEGREDLGLALVHARSVII